jgi:hypothetical protein
MAIDLESFKQHWTPSQPDAEQQLLAALKHVRDERGSHRTWAPLRDEAGFDGLDLTEYQLALSDDPDDVVALEQLVVLYREGGENERALSCPERQACLEALNEDLIL